LATRDKKNHQKVSKGNNNNNNNNNLCSVDRAAPRYMRVMKPT
jgi:hypothetical protein